MDNSQNQEDKIAQLKKTITKMQMQIENIKKIFKNIK